MATTSSRRSPFASRMQAEANTNTGAGAEGAKPKAPQAQVYLNFGYIIEVEDAEGQPHEDFISLPFGLPLDTMNQSQMTGQNVDYANKLAARNNLLADLLAHAETFEPGQAEYLIVDEATGMAVEIRRRGTPAVASTDNNPYLRRLEFAAPK